MANICIVRVRSNHELVWRLPRPLRAVSPYLPGRVSSFLSGIDGMPFLSQMTSYYLAALGEAAARRLGADHSFRVIEDREESIEIPDDADLVLMTANTPAAPATYRVADRIRRRGVPVAIGGIHASMLPAEAAQHADSVVVGEAEGVMDDLLADFAALGRPRDHYRGGRGVSLDRLPAPRWPCPPERDACPWVVPVQTSRGCRNACAFCSTTRHQGPARRHRPVEEIVAEIRGYIESGFLGPEKLIFFTDNNIVCDTDHRTGKRDDAYARSLFAALEPLGIFWAGQGEISVADDPGALELMARSGCHLLLVGLESLDQRNLGTVGKVGNRTEDYVRRIEALHRHGVRIIGCFILGMDNDTTDVFDRTAEFIEEHIDVPQISVLTPFPGTALFSRMEREGRILHRDWSRYDITHVVFRPSGMSPEELDAGHRGMLRRVFRWDKMLGRATRAALRRVEQCVPPETRRSRLKSTLAPNLVYASLGWVEPDEAARVDVGGTRPARDVVYAA
ncbi:MAG: radical SAM protein [Myxococcota bacterium]|nr:radical SAM protein [Myxococcota bacterium]